jgi:Uma2 family endonuclease
MSVMANSIPALKKVSDPLTYEDYKTFPDDDRIRKEIIDGELFMAPAPSIKHQIISQQLFVLLYNYITKNNLGKVFYAPCDIIFSNINVPYFILSTGLALSLQFIKQVGMII